MILILLPYYKAQEECPKVTPVRNIADSQCMVMPCSEEDINNNICIIENSQMKIQWINKY